MNPVDEIAANAGVSRHHMARAFGVVIGQDGHISTIRRTWQTIFTAWFPASACEIADAPEFERCDERFDPESGLGRIRDLGAD